MEIRNYAYGDEHAIITLFELTFKQKMTLEQWNWRFTNNPAGKHWIKLMWEDDILIGHYAASPLLMEVKGKSVLTAHSLATMTHPDHGGKGIFKMLSKSLYDDLENQLGCKAIWGFPNNNSHYGFISSLGWQDLVVIHTLGMPFQALLQHADAGISISEFENFTEKHAAFIGEKTNLSPVKVSRSIEYLNWRFVAKPSVKYKKFFGEIDGSRYLLVTKIYPSSKADMWDLNIIELHIDDFQVLKKIIIAIGSLYNLAFDRVTIWQNLHSVEHNKLEKIGFVMTVPQTYLSARIHPDMDCDFAEIKKWHFSMGDSDVF